MFLRLFLSTSMRGFEPCRSCFVLKPARIMSRKRESIPGHVPSLAAPLKPLPFSFSVLAVSCLFLKVFQSCLCESNLKTHFVNGYFIHLTTKTSPGERAPCTAKTAIGQTCSHLTPISFHSDRRQISWGSHALRCFAFDFVNKLRQLLMVKGTTPAQF